MLSTTLLYIGVVLVIIFAIWWYLPYFRNNRIQKQETEKLKQWIGRVNTWDYLAIKAGAVYGALLYATDQHPMRNTICNNNEPYFKTLFFPSQNITHGFKEYLLSVHADNGGEDEHSMAVLSLRIRGEKPFMVKVEYPEMPENEFTDLGDAIHCVTGVIRDFHPEPVSPW